MKWLANLACLLILIVSCQASQDPVSPSQAPVISKPAKPRPIPPPSIPCTPVPPSTATAKKILFVGNSLTYFNDLPALVKQIAAGQGREVEVQSLTFGNYALEDHWNDGCVQVLIASGYYDFVVVQQGPSSQAEGRAILLEYGQLLKDLCQKADTQLAFYMVWPALANYANFDGVIKNYSDAATITKSVLCPAGRVWKQHFDDTGDFSYYGPDSFHPSLLGSHVAAQSIYESLFP